MMPWTQSVFSSNVREVGYDEDSHELLITWNSGRVSAYSGVPEDVALRLTKAASVGQMINSEIKNVYPHRYV